MRLPNNGVRLRVALVLLAFGLILAFRWLPGNSAEQVATKLVAANGTTPSRSSPAFDSYNDSHDDNDNDSDPSWPDRGLIKQSDRVANLGSYAHDASAQVIPA